MIGIESIAASGTLAGNATLLSEPIDALIDTTLPYFWLPLQACQRFETAFGLSWDASTEMYLVNDTIHQQLLNLDPSVTITLGPSSADQSIDIKLPYGAFDLQASAPVYPNGTNYFPLRRASSPDQYALGRAFLQEAYLLVDFERGNFSVSQALFPADSAPNIVTIDHTSPPSVPGSKTDTPSAPPTKHDLSAGAITGTAIGCSTLIIILSLILIALYRALQRRHSSPNRQRTQRTSTSSHPPSGGKESWPSSPAGSSPTLSDTAPPRELEDTEARRPLGGRGRGAPVQELAGSPAAKELPPLPPCEKTRRVVPELASNEL